MVENKPFTQLQDSSVVLDSLNKPFILLQDAPVNYDGLYKPSPYHKMVLMCRIVYLQTWTLPHDGYVVQEKYGLHKMYSF